MNVSCMSFFSECQMGAGPPPKPAEAPQILERGPPTRNVTAPEESEKEKADTEREKPDSDTESDVDDPYVFFCPRKHTQCFIHTLQIKFEQSHT